jgi:hypothetical protein
VAHHNLLLTNLLHCTATVLVPVCRTVSVPSVSVLLQCRTHWSLLRLSLSATRSVYRVSVLLQCRTHLSATAPVPLCHTVSVPSVSVLLQCRTHCLLLRLSLSATRSVYRLSLSCIVGMSHRPHCVPSRLSYNLLHTHTYDYVRVDVTCEWMLPTVYALMSLQIAVPTE